MAVRTHGPGSMIPLGKWLADGRTNAFPDLMNDEPRSAAAVHAESEAAQLADAYERGRTEALAESNTRWEQRLTDALQQAERSAEDRLQSWSQGVAADLRVQIGAAFDNVRQAVETSLCDVLRPFLDEQVIARSVSELKSLIDDDLARGGEPLIEIKVPDVLAQSIALAFEGRCNAVTVVPGTHVSVSFNHHTARFETLCTDWLKALEVSHHGG